MEHNYAGFKDKVAQMTPARYEQFSGELLGYAKGRHAREECLMIISQYLDRFKDEHVSVKAGFDATKTDSSFVRQRRIIDLPDKRIAALKNSTTAEGIYLFRFDSSYRIAVIKDSTLLHDYIGVIIDSRLPGWKKGMLKFEGKKVNDSLLKGVLYLRNQLPKQEWFYLGKDFIGGDWQREGTVRENKESAYEEVSSKKLSDSTFYVKISDFDPSNAKNIDSLFRANKKILDSTPNLIIDLRDNGGGSDFTYGPLVPYIYTTPVKSIGVDVLSTEANISGWKKVLDDKDLPEYTIISIKKIINKMEANKDSLVNINSDNTDSFHKKRLFPSKVVILINKGCASTTEQFLLEARQSSKVILMGENTSGTLDYSNVREAAFSCMPYVLHYSTTRSRRLNINQGIDNIGIRPDRYLSKKEDWIRAAVAELEK